MIVAIDGPAGAGKSTIAKLVAGRLGFLYIDTGAMYRALTLKIIEKGIDGKNTQAIIDVASTTSINLTNNIDGSLKVILDRRDVSQKIREPGVTRYVSDVARIKEVREILVKLQRSLGASGDCIIDGRDIGTVVFPDAQYKFYLDASFGERVNRRYKELVAAGHRVTPDSVAADVRNRDTIDSNREYAPLKQAEDAIGIDTTSFTIDQVVEKILSYISRYTEQNHG